MKKILLPVVVLALYACGSEESNEATTASESNIITAEALLDSAMNVSFESDLAADKSAAIALFEEAIEMDKGLKAAYIGRIGLLSEIGSDQELLNALVEAQTAFPFDAYLALHLGMEFELQNQSDKAEPLYTVALESFESILDTMASKNALLRNSLLMNMAMADVLANGEMSNEQIAQILSNSEAENFGTAKEQFKTMDRAALLNLRRK